MVSGSQYGGIIRHIEPSHLSQIPVPDSDPAMKTKMNGLMDRVINLRNTAASQSVAAEKAFSEAVDMTALPSGMIGFSVSARAMLEGRRRLEAAYHAPGATAVIDSFDKSESLEGVTSKVYWMSRFKRVYGDGGLPYLSADELFTMNPQMTKRILVAPDDGHEKYFVKRDWIVMACSGQIYGLNGAAMLMTPHHEKTFFSHDLIRIIPDPKKIRAGYLLTALTHPTLGRPVLIREAYGTSIPHLDPGDVARFPVVRLDTAVENRIADLAEDAARARAEADEIERAMAIEADEIIEQFIS